MWGFSDFANVVGYVVGLTDSVGLTVFVDSADFAHVADFSYFADFVAFVDLGSNSAHSSEFRPYSSDFESFKFLFAQYQSI